MFEKLSENLKKLGYNVSCFETAAEAAGYLNSEIDGKTVGFGGSVTLNDMGLYEALSEHNTVYWHWKAKDQQENIKMRELSALSDVYLSSANAISENGEIINIDGNCNRVAAIFYGHKKVYIVAGKNKIADDYDSALFRARNIAAPLNAKRLGVKTPCAAKADKCFNCSSPERICRGLSVMWSKPMSGEYEVVLINEDIGY